MQLFEPNQPSGVLAAGDRHCVRWRGVIIFQIEVELWMEVRMQRMIVLEELLV